MKPTLNIRPILMSIVTCALTFSVFAGPKVTDLAWMSGTWSGPTGPNSTLEENWTKPVAGTMASMVRGTGEGRTTMIEMIVIEEENDSLVLRLQQWDPGFKPRTEKPQTMKLLGIEGRSVRWEAIDEGGIKRLSYSRPADDKFVITVETPAGQKFDIPLMAK